jgi:hypothetical protein
MNKHWKKQELRALREFYEAFVASGCHVLTLGWEMWGRADECKDVCNPRSRAICKAAQEVAWIREQRQLKALRRSEYVSDGKRS